MAHGRQFFDVLVHTTKRTGAAVAAVWQSEDVRRLLRTWYVRLLAAAALALGLATAFVNLWAVRIVNTNLLPQVSAAASRALDRDVSTYSSTHAVDLPCCYVSSSITLGHPKLIPALANIADRTVRDYR